MLICNPIPCLYRIARARAVHLSLSLRTCFQETKRKRLGILGKLCSQALGEVVLNVVVVPVVLLASVHACMEREGRKQERRAMHERIQTKEENSKSENQQGPGASFSTPPPHPPLRSGHTHPLGPLLSFVVDNVLGGVSDHLRYKARPTASRPTVRLHPPGHHLDPGHPSTYSIPSRVRL